MKMTFEEYPNLNVLIKVLLKKLNRNKLVVIDVGAFNGVNCVLLKKDFRDVVIHAIEPCPINYKVLVRKVKHLKNIIPYKKAISDTNGEECLYIINRNGKGGTSSQSNSLFENFIKLKRPKNWKKVFVITQTLSSFCEHMKIGRIDLLKLNCEGCEYKIFDDTSSHYIFDKVNIIRLTLHGKTKEFQSLEYGNKRNNINNFLTSKGFKLLYTKGKITKKTKEHISQIWARQNKP